MNATSQPTSHTQEIGMIVDSCVLLLIIVGIFDKNIIDKCKKIDHYSKDDFDLALQIVARYSNIYITPHILAELSNLSRKNSLPSRNLLDYFQ